MCAKWHWLRRLSILMCRDFVCTLEAISLGVSERERERESHMTFPPLLHPLMSFLTLYSSAVHSLCWSCWSRAAVASAATTDRERVPRLDDLLLSICTCKDWWVALDGSFDLSAFAFLSLSLSSHFRSLFGLICIWESSRLSPAFVCSCSGGAKKGRETTKDQSLCSSRTQKKSFPREFSFKDRESSFRIISESLAEISTFSIRLSLPFFPFLIEPPNSQNFDCDFWEILPVCWAQQNFWSFQSS